LAMLITESAFRIERGRMNALPDILCLLQRQINLTV